MDWLETSHWCCTQVAAPASGARLTSFIIYLSCCTGLQEVLLGLFFLSFSVARGTMNLLNWTKWKCRAMGPAAHYIGTFFFFFLQILSVSSEIISGDVTSSLQQLRTRMQHVKRCTDDGLWGWTYVACRASNEATYVRLLPRTDGVCTQEVIIFNEWIKLPKTACCTS